MRKKSRKKGHEHHPTAAAAIELAPESEETYKTGLLIGTKHIYNTAKILHSALKQWRGKRRLSFQSIYYRQPLFNAENKETR